MEEKGFLDWAENATRTVEYRNAADTKALINEYFQVYNDYRDILLDYMN